MEPDEDSDRGARRDYMAQWLYKELIVEETKRCAMNLVDVSRTAAFAYKAADALEFARNKVTTND
jgi:hypothetical protein